MTTNERMSPMLDAAGLEAIAEQAYLAEVERAAALGRPALASDCVAAAEAAVFAEIEAGRVSRAVTVTFFAKLVAPLIQAGMAPDEAVRTWFAQREAAQAGVEEAERVLRDGREG